MTQRMPPWSWSGLSSFETCPRRYYHIKVAKDVLDSPGEAARWGSEVHRHLENRLRDSTPLPYSVAGYEEMVAPFLGKQETLLVEKQIAVDSAHRPVEWESDKAWCRGIVDVGLVGSKKAMLFDWKTGKRKVDTQQLKLFAALAFAEYESVETIVTGFVWLKDNKIDKETFKRSDTVGIWNEFAPRIARLERAYESGMFPQKPSGLCKRYCPVPKSKCEFSGT